LPGVDWLSFPFAGLGLFLAVAGTMHGLAQKSTPVLALAGGGLSGAVLLVVGLWPSVFNPLLGQRPGTNQAGQQAFVLPVGKGTGRATTTVTEDTWVDASREAVQRGDVRVRVQSATVATAPFKDPARGRSARDRHLLIALRIYNTGAERRIAYTSWGEPATGRESELARLTDHAGRAYHLRGFDPGIELVGRSAQARVSPGQYVDDLLVFEPPAASLEYLRLELPAAACSSSGTFRLQLPRSQITYR
jgi:hypothetical protein